MTKEEEHELMNKLENNVSSSQVIQEMVEELKLPYEK